MGSAIVEVSLARERPAEEWLVEELAGIAGAGDARVVLLDATAPAPIEKPFTATELRDIALFELPVVFAFESALRGPLTDLALAADIRVCGEDASLQGRLASNARARTLAGDAMALALFLGREAVAAAALLDGGLVSTVTPPGGALSEARRLCEVVAARGPVATRLAKEAIWRGLGLPLEQGLRFETDLTLLLQTTKDRAEGVRAFLEKRTPNFAGE